MVHHSQIYYLAVTIVSIIGVYLLMQYIWYWGATYPSAIPTIMVTTLVISMIALLLIFLSTMNDERSINFWQTIFQIIGTIVFWGIINVVVFLVISFFVMVAAVR